MRGNALVSGFWTVEESKNIEVQQDFEDDFQLPSSIKETGKICMSALATKKFIFKSCIIFRVRLTEVKFLQSNLPKQLPNIRCITIIAAVIFGEQKLFLN